MSEEVKQVETFDFELHKEKAVDEFIKIRPLYDAYISILRNILEKCLLGKEIRFHSIEARAKSIESFGEKAKKPSEVDPNKPKYENPIKEITDLAGLRIITFFPMTLKDVNMIIYEELEIIEKSDKGELLDQEEKLGYQSVHYLVKLKSSRTALAEYKRFEGLIAEIQVRTILQHAWAEIEHDIEYKSITTIPVSIKRRFMALAGMLEIADREFQSIHDEDIKLRNEARKSVQEGKLEEVEITPDSLKAYLDKRLGSDGRMSDFSYSYEARILIKMGFSKLQQIDECIKGYDDDRISKVLWGTRQGQLSRFEDMILAGMGENFISRHPWSKSGEDSCVKSISNRLKRLSEAKIPIKNYNL